MSSTVKERLLEFIEASNISINRFERSAGLAVGYIRQLRREPSPTKLRDILAAFPHLNENWLLTGEGEMIVYPEETTVVSESEPPVYEPMGKSWIPLIHLDSVGGVWSQNALAYDEQYVERLIPFEGARQGDVAILHSGDSMSPAIPPGAILQIRKVEGWKEYFGYGNVYVLWLKDDRRITKLVQRYDPDPHNYILLRSYNHDHNDEEIPRSFIREVWKVIKVLVDKGW